MISQGAFHFRSCLAHAEYFLQIYTSCTLIETSAMYVVGHIQRIAQLQNLPLCKYKKTVPKQIYPPIQFQHRAAKVVLFEAGSFQNIATLLVGHIF